MKKKKNRQETIDKIGKVNKEVSKGIYTGIKDVLKNITKNIGIPFRK